MPSSTSATSIWPLSTGNLPSVTAELKCSFHLILVNLNLSSHIMSIAIIHCVSKKRFHNLLRESLYLVKEVELHGLSRGGSGCIPDLFLPWANFKRVLYASISQYILHCLTFKFQICFIFMSVSFQSLVTSNLHFKFLSLIISFNL